MTATQQHDFQRIMTKSNRKAAAKKAAMKHLMSVAKPVENSQRLLDGEAEEEAQFTFDVTGYSLKYARCQMIEQYSDDAAEEGGEDDEAYNSVLVRKRFAVFRLCPSSSCSSSRQMGCQNGYGEYMVDLGEYLDTMQRYNEELKESYCDFCENYMQELEAYGEDEDEAEEDEEESEDENGEDRRRKLEGQQEENEENEENEEENGESEDQEEGVFLFITVYFIQGFSLFVLELND